MGIDIPDAAIEKDDDEEKPTGKGSPTIGATFSGNRISGVEPGSQAWNLGLARDDEVLAINGFRVTNSFSDRLRQYEVGDRIELLITRDERLFSETVTLERKLRKDWSIGWISNPSDDQATRINAWLEIEPPESDNDSEGDDKKDSVGKTSEEKKTPKKKKRRKKPLKS
jgi:predicted metalloprotease with PDZ domain